MHVPASLQFASAPNMRPPNRNGPYNLTSTNPDQPANLHHLIMAFALSILRVHSTLSNDLISGHERF